ncbi:MAG: hypothetical protein HWE27_00580 [Gammaproteobacteria bacterium]|nr:hypothetical protein [Gammaproteobacteria bacterium]
MKHNIMKNQFLKASLINKKLLASAFAFTLTLSTQAASTVVAGDSDYIPLGTGYNSVTGEFLNYQTVQGRASEVVGEQGTNFFFETNQNYQQIASVINGSVTADLNFPVASVDAGAEIALESASDEFSSNWVFMARHHAKSKVLLKNPGDSDVVLSPQGQAVYDKRNQLSDSQLLATVGNEFVREIERSALLFVSMKAEYVSASDKLAFEGALDVDFALGDVSGELDYLNDKQKSSINITVRAHQFGGDPLALLKAIPDNFVQCSALNFDTCRQLFENVIQYARSMEGTEFEDTGFSKMILTPSNSNVVGYKTQPYFGTASLVHALGRRDYQVDDNSDVIRELQRDYAEQMQNKSRATSLLSRSSSYLNQYQRQSLRFITEAAQKNADTLQDLVQYCEINILNNDCANYLTQHCDKTNGRRTCLTTYSQKVLDLGGSNDLDLVLKTYSYPIKMQSGIDASYLLVGAKNSGADWNHNNQTGKVTTNGWGFQFSGFFNEKRKGSFLTKSSKRLAIASPLGVKAPVNGSYTMRVYTADGWEVGREKKYGGDNFVYSEVLNRAIKVDGLFHYLTEWDIEKNDEPEASVTMAFWAQQFGKGSVDLYFFLDRTITVPMLNKEIELFDDNYQLVTHSDTSPWFYTAQNINIAKDVNGNDIGWCVDNSGNVTRSNTALCNAKGRLYNQTDSEKACAAYSAQHEASTGLFWGLPTTVDGINMSIRLRAEMDDDVEGSAVYARSHLLGGENAWSLGILPYGYISSPGTTNGTRQYIEGATAYYWMASPQLNRLNFTSKPYILTAMWGHTEQAYPARCVGKFSR